MFGFSSMGSLRLRFGFSSLYNGRERYSRRLIPWRVLYFVIVVIIAFAPGSSSTSLSLGDFYIGDPLQVMVSNLTSPITKLSYEFYSLPYCKPSMIKTLKSYQNSVYTFDMRKDESCTVACRVRLDAEAAKNFKEKIHDNYQVNMVVGNLPEKGFRVGFKGTYNSGEEVHFIHNHLSFRVMYRRNPQTHSAQIVNFVIDPYSINHKYEGPWNETHPQVLTCNQSNNGVDQSFKIPLRVETDKEVIFTYDVSFFEDDGRPRIRYVLYPSPDMIF